MDFYLARWEPPLTEDRKEGPKELYLTGADSVAFDLSVSAWIAGQRDSPLSLLSFSETTLTVIYHVRGQGKHLNMEGPWWDRDAAHPAQFLKLIRRGVPRNSNYRT